MASTASSEDGHAGDGASAASNDLRREAYDIADLFDQR